MAITMLVTFNVKSEYIQAFKEALIDDQKNARLEAGNIAMELHRHRDKENVFYLYERWENQAVLEAHFEQPYTKKILDLNEVGLISPMEVEYLEDL